jgi:hypothetical protein
MAASHTTFVVVADMLLLVAMLFDQDTKVNVQTLAGKPYLGEGAQIMADVIVRPTFHELSV